MMTGRAGRTRSAVTRPVVVVGGPPCSGKSTSARALADLGVLVEVDSVLELMLPDSDRSQSDRMLAYDVAHSMARALRLNGRLPILECTYSRREQRESLVRTVDADPVFVVELHIDPDVAVERFRRRPGPTDLDEALVRRRAETYPYTHGALNLEAATDVVTLTNEIRAWFRAEPRPVDPEAWAESGNGWTV